MVGRVTSARAASVPTGSGPRASASAIRRWAAVRASAPGTSSANTSVAGGASGPSTRASARAGVEP